MREVNRYKNSPTLDNILEYSLIIKVLKMISKILKKFFSFILFLLLYQLSLAGQAISPPTSELQRKFIRLELQAIKLSEQIADTAGTEPIQLIDRNESLSPIEVETAQQSYDSLPGPYNSIGFRRKN